MVAFLLTMNSYTILPDNYEELYEINLEKSKKLTAIVFGLFGLIAIIMVLIALPFRSFSDTFNINFDGKTHINLLVLASKLLVLTVGLMVYVFLHELIHALFFKIYGSKKISFGLTLKYAYAKSDAYYPKKPYLVIALAPVVILGAILLTICFFMQNDWFWVVYIIAIQNFGGASGDFYVTYKLLNDKRKLLIYDFGTSMKVYAEKSN